MKNEYIVKTEKFEGHENANARIVYCADGNILLKSYNTTVLALTPNNWLYCSGLYSRTTIKHIGWFMSKFGSHYYVAKAAALSNMMVNIKTEDMITYDEFEEKYRNVA